MAELIAQIDEKKEAGAIYTSSTGIAVAVTIDGSGPTVWHSAAASATLTTLKNRKISRAKRSAAMPIGRL